MTPAGSLDRSTLMLRMISLVMNASSCDTQKVRRAIHSGDNPTRIVSAGNNWSGTMQAEKHAASGNVSRPKAKFGDDANPTIICMTNLKLRNGGRASEI